MPENEEVVGYISLFKPKDYTEWRLLIPTITNESNAERACRTHLANWGEEDEVGVGKIYLM
jgi:hypothetical protein